MRVYQDRQRCDLCGRWNTYGVTETILENEGRRTVVCAPCVSVAIAKLIFCSHPAAKETD